MSLLPSDQTVIGNLTVAGNIVSFTNTVSTDAYGDLQTTSRTNFIDAHTPFGITSLRDTVITDGIGSSVSKDIGLPEHTLFISSDTGDMASLRTKKRGKYVAGNSAEAMIAVRIGGSAFTQGQECAWGYFDDDNGFLFFCNKDGLYVTALKSGTREGVTHISDFNVDKLDGNGPSRHTLDLSKGYVWKIAFSSVYGAVLFRVVLNDMQGNQVIQTVHRHVSPDGTPVTNNLNLPVSVDLIQSEDENYAEQRSVYVSERQYSIIGGIFSFNCRTSSAYVLNRNVNLSNGFVPLMSVRRKSAWRLGTVIKLSSMDISGSNECLLQLRLNASLSDGTNFGSLQDTAQEETALEMDDSSSAVEGGIVLFTGMIPISPSNGRFASDVQAKELGYHVEDEQTFTLVVNSYLVDTSRVTGVLRFTEEW